MNLRRSPSVHTAIIALNEYILVNADLRRQALRSEELETATDRHDMLTQLERERIELENGVAALQGLQLHQQRALS